MHTTIQAAWDQYRKLAFPADLSEPALRTAQTTFYAGAISCLSTILGVASGDYSEEAKSAILQGLHDEGHLYIQQILGTSERLPEHQG